MDLNSDLLKLEDELETTINSSMDVNEKTKKIKTLLSSIAITEASVTKFSNMVSITNNNILND